jgi:hypothetical protein
MCILSVHPGEVAALLIRQTWSSTTDWVLGWQLVAAKRVLQPGHYELQGEERLGASLIISPLEGNGLDISTCTIQWHRESADRSKGGPITGEHHTVVVEVMQLRNEPNFDLSAYFCQNVDNDWHPKVVRLSHVLVQAAQLREYRPMQLFLDSDSRRPHQKLNPGSFACLRISNLHLHTFICEWLQVPPGLNMHQNLLM